MHANISHQFRRFSSVLLRFLSSLALIAGGPAAMARPAELSGSAKSVIEQFLMNQANGLPGKVSIRIDTPMSGALPACDNPEPFLPNGARLWGRVSVGVRCSGDGSGASSWTRYVPAYVAVVANYYVASRPLNAGETLSAADFEVRQGDLCALPRGVITNPQQASGMIIANRIAPGAPLRQELLRNATVILQGQNVRVLAQGAGFVVSTEGRAMTNAAAGATIQVKTQAGQMVSGIARADGSVDLPN
ncbi:flagella basal body P-ring formation protein FlgA [Collimonas arenae]|uniref:Flagella basal body P-ring formation protein FlgA n=1 Tax=Collimonas arenae TaxID=279058 RepID=A0A127QFX8_9BURK|nr:flagellar basal body P-ring formation chaperone FlgA [Collimonas arenae]AMO98828.1 flagella basal body P-ring formation protein FlgA [Collimonas arenae]AMP08725.1 flagella basal body P-ring formation protein FlgA [Collimonas arenae]